MVKHWMQIHSGRMGRCLGKLVIKILTSKKGEILGLNDFELRFWVIQSPLEQRNIELNEVLME